MAGPQPTDPVASALGQEVGPCLQGATVTTPTFAPPTSQRARDHAARLRADKEQARLLAAQYSGEARAAQRPFDPLTPYSSSFRHQQGNQTAASPSPQSVLPPDFPDFCYLQDRGPASFPNQYPSQAGPVLLVPPRLATPHLTPAFPPQSFSPYQSGSRPSPDSFSTRANQSVSPFGPATQPASQRRFPPDLRSPLTQSPFASDLIPPHRPGGYNPSLNPHIPPQGSSKGDLKKKKSIWDFKKQKSSKGKVSGSPPARPISPIRRSRSNSQLELPSQDFFDFGSTTELLAESATFSQPRSGPPRPGKTIKLPPKPFPKTFTRKASKAVLTFSGKTSKTLQQLKRKFGKKAQTETSSPELSSHWGQDAFDDRVERSLSYTGERARPTPPTRVLREDSKSAYSEDSPFPEYEFKDETVLYPRQSPEIERERTAEPRGLTRAHRSAAVGAQDRGFLSFLALDRLPNDQYSLDTPRKTVRKAVYKTLTGVQPSQSVYFGSDTNDSVQSLQQGLEDSPTLGRGRAHGIIRRAPTQDFLNESFSRGDLSREYFPRQDVPGQDFTNRRPSTRRHKRHRHRRQPPCPRIREDSSSPPRLRRRDASGDINRRPPLLRREDATIGSESGLHRIEDLREPAERNNYLGFEELGGLGITTQPIHRENIEVSNFQVDPTVSSGRGEGDAPKQFSLRRVKTQELPRQAAFQASPTLPPLPALPAGSRKVSDLRTRFEQQAGGGSSIFPRKKSLPPLPEVKKNLPRSEVGEIDLPLQQEGVAPAVASPRFNPLDSYLANNQSDSSSNIDGPTSPIPPKSFKRELAPQDPIQSLTASFEQANLASSSRAEPEIRQIRLRSATVRPNTPENNKQGTLQQVDTEVKYSPSVYSEELFETPPDKHPDLLPSPLAIIKKTKQDQASTSNSPDISSTDINSPSTSAKDPFRSTNSFFDRCLPVSIHPTQMETLQVSSAIRSSTRTKAVEDARAMQQSVIESCKKAGRDPPKYVLLELIGKGSFGRVYKGKDVISTAIVAVKIIDIDESDTLNPRLADTYSEFMKEVNALKILSESKARNINHVIEALPVGKAMWMITEYCGGGSIATLMKPTPTGLKERFIIPILREVAEAVKWVHQAGIIHRDLKCANILITEEGGVQLCDFGVAGITETALDKRSTFIGTFNWMAPELFQGSQYGKEVDIWAFGSMAYEMATGLPPNAMSGVSGMDLGPYLKTHIPRLEGGNYTDGLRSLVAFCLEENPSDRPTIEAVQRHGYIYNTSTKYPASTLSELVKAFKMWELHGGSRKSLFMAGGAQGPSGLSSTALSDDNWNFSTTAAFDQAVAQDTSAQDVINVYGASVALDTDFLDETSRPSRQQQSRSTRRRPPPEALAPLKAPLEKLFDPNTMSNYEDNARTHYNQHQNTLSDLPLRNNSDQNSIRDTMIDLDISTGLSTFSDMDTIRAQSRVRDESEDEYDPGPLHDFSRPALSDPADNPNRRTQDWKFPVMAPPASANPEVTRFPTTYEVQRPSVTPSTRPTLVHHPTEPIGLSTQSSNSLMPSAPSSPNRMSLIDLDLSLPEPSRPSTADSTTSQEVNSANPFHLERHYHASAREPSLYVSEDSAIGSLVRSNSSLQDFTEVSDFSASDAEGTYYEQYNGHSVHSEQHPYDDAGFVPAEYEQSAVPNPLNNATNDSIPHPNQGYTMAHFPALPSPPSVAALSGTASHREMTNEMQRMLGGLTSQLESFRDVYEGLLRRDRDRRDRGVSGDEE